MTPQEYIRTGNLPGALQSAKEAVRANPSDGKSRICLFQVESLLGHWEKAQSHLEVLAQIDAEMGLFAQIFSPVVECELLRSEVFAGKRTPIIFGEPEEWMGQLVHANQLFANGDYEAAAQLRDSAFEAAEALPGAADGAAFSWFADADPRLGPVLEVIMDGCYRWVPLCRIAEMHFEAPKDLRDLVWCPTRFTWTNDGCATGFIPSRYPQTEASPDDALKLSRRTEWVEKPYHYFQGMGQRVFATNLEEYPLLTLREVTIQQALANSSASNV